MRDLIFAKQSQPEKFAKTRTRKVFLEIELKLNSEKTGNQFSETGHYVLEDGESAFNSNSLTNTFLPLKASPQHCKHIQLYIPNIFLLLVLQASV